MQARAEPRPPLHSHKVARSRESPWLRSAQANRAARPQRLTGDQGPGLTPGPILRGFLGSSAGGAAPMEVRWRATLETRALLARRNTLAWRRGHDQWRRSPFSWTVRPRSEA